MRTVDANLHPAHSISTRFFGKNAADWLGLASGQATRMRLEAFYKAKGIDITKNPPTWLAKV
jgi:hypothetical protein